MRVYGDEMSGNCYKIQLLLSHLGQNCEWIPMDILAGDTRAPDFLKKNPNGKIPLLETDAGEFIPESNAILNYLAHDTEYLPTDRLLRTRVLSWQFFEQYSHEPTIAVARFINRYLGMPADRKQEYQDKQEGGNKALQVMETHLASREFLVGEQFSIADISLYAYTHVAHEGGFDLKHYNAITKWLDRVASLPNHKPMAA